jgi:PAS domain S-box-containing protein
VSRPHAALALATALGAVAFGVSLGAGAPAIALALALVASVLVVERPRRWGTRLACASLIAYLAVWGYVRVETRRVSSRAPEQAERLAADRRADVARVLERRLARDRALAEATAARLAEAAERMGPVVVQDPELFVALEHAVTEPLPSGLGLEVYDPEGGLRAWWGDSRGERLPPDSIPVAAAGGAVRRPAGFTIAHVAVPWVVGPDTFHVAVKDVWEIESPLGRDIAHAGLLLPRLERAHDLAFRVAPLAEGADVEPVHDPAGRVVAAIADDRFLLDRWLEERREAAGTALALLLLWPLVWSVNAAWYAARRARPGWQAVLGQVAVLGLVWAFLMETTYPALLLPEAWFSPLAFASTSFGPAGKSAGHFVLTAAIAAALVFALWDRVPRRRATLASVAAVVGGAVLAFVLVRALGWAVEDAMRTMSPPVFFSATLLFSPPYLMVLLAFALLAAVAITGLAMAFRAAGVPAGRGWATGAAAVTGAAALAAAWTLPEAAMAGTRSTLAPLVALGLIGAAWLAHAAAHGRGEGTLRLALVATTLGGLLMIPLAAHGRVQAATDLLVERAGRIGEASIAWLQYTMERTRQFLEGEPEVAQAIVERNRDAALVLWSRSPLRELDFASALYLFDTEGQLVSQFSLASVDLGARARAYAQAVGEAPFGVEGSEGSPETRWTVVPVSGPGGVRVGTAVAMTTGALDLREQTPGSAFVLTDLLAGGGLAPDVPGYTTLRAGEIPPPRTLITDVRRSDGAVRLAMPLDPLLPVPRSYAVFAVVGALAGLGLGVVVRLGDLRTRLRWWAALRTQNPMRSFRVQLMLAFLAIAVVPLTVYAVIGYRHTRFELETATRTAAADGLNAASRILAGDPALERGTTSALSQRLREIGEVLQQDLILYWRGWTIASSRPEIFASRLFADRMAGAVYTNLFAVGRPIVFDRTTLGDRSFLVAYRSLVEPGTPPGYVLATPLWIREDRVRIDLQRLGEGVFLLSALSLGFLLAVGRGLARFMARPLSALEQGTRRIASGRLSYRLATPVRRDEFGRLQGAFNTMAARLDVSQRELEGEKSRVQAILASVGAGVVALDGSGLVRLLNERAETLLDQRAEEVIDRPVYELAEVDGAAARFWRAVARDFVRGQRSDRDLVLRKNGQERHYHLVSTALKNSVGEERGLVIAFEDITANVQSQRVLAWGEMARQVAHEIKNPLTPMKLSLQHLEHTLENRSDDFQRVFHENLDLVLSEIDRLERIATNFARFAFPDPTVSAPFDAVEVAREALALFGPGEEPVSYSLELVGEPRPLIGETEGFRRILMNLLQNARQAVLAVGGGEVELRIDWEREAGWARVSVLDEGIGLPAEGLDRLFEPSFSTKTRGTGLGLAITKRIVEAWNGTIGWEAREPVGTAFHVRLRTTGTDPVSPAGRRAPAT